MADLKMLARRIASLKPEDDARIISELMEHVPLEASRLLTAEIEAIWLDQRAEQLEKFHREKSERPEQFHRERKAAQRELDKADFEAEMARQDEHVLRLSTGGTANAAPDATDQLARTLTQLIEMRCSPREILRDNQGRVTGVRIVEQTPQAQQRAIERNVTENYDGSVSVVLTDEL